jgi:DNA phosphorothioation-dependent restriction protein DptG
LDEAEHFPLAMLVFFFRGNVGVVKINRGLDPAFDHALEDRARAGRATGMKQDFLFVVGNLQIKRACHKRLFEK